MPPADEDADEKIEASEVADDDDDTPVKKVREASTTKVEVFIPKGLVKSRNAPAQISEPAEEPQEDVNRNYFLDLLFSFISVSSDENSLEELQRVKLNLFAVSDDVSRVPPGTPANDGSPTSDNDSDDPTFNVLQKRTVTPAAPTEYVGGEPKLLQVSCGYFKNIVLKVLFKQKNILMKYLLVETNGQIFDKLASLAGTHYSLSTLLIELMQVGIVAYPRQMREKDARQYKFDDDGNYQENESEEEVKEAQPESAEEKEAAELRQLLQ